jgi:hypothetical protein
MFGLFRKKTKEPPSAQGRMLPLASDLSDETLVGAVHQVFVGQKPVVAALFLVALENLPVYYSVFCNAAHEEKQYVESMDGMVDFVRRAYAEHQGTSELDEVNRRRWFYLYVAALLNIAHRRARSTPELWHSIADIWVLLMDGARSLRATLDRTDLWKPTEVDFFASVKTEDDGEKFVESVLLPKEIRYHAKLTAWQERDLSPEVREELAKMDKLLRGE